MGQTLFRLLPVLAITLMLISGSVSSAPSANSPARILNGVFSNAASVFLKWFSSLKTARSSKPGVNAHHRPMVKFENGYTVETVFDGSKLGLEPHSVEVLRDGQLLILDSENSNVYTISTPLSLYSRPKLVAGSPEGSPGYFDGRPREAKLNHPKGMAVDDNGNIYVADTNNMAIRKISKTGVTTIVGGKLARGGGHVDGPGEDAKLSNDFDVVYIGSSCSLLVVDRGNRAIREIQLHFDDCAYQFGSGFPFGIGIVVAAGVLGYLLAFLQLRPHMDETYSEMKNKDNFRTRSESKEDHSGLLSRLRNLFANGPASFGQIFLKFIPGFIKSPVANNQVNTQIQRYQQHSYSNDWLTQQDSFDFPEDEPPPLVTDTRAPTPKKTYAFMSNDSEKMYQIRQSHVFQNAWENTDQPRQQLRIQQATVDSRSPHHPISDKKAAKEQDRDRPRRRKSVPKPVEPRTSSQDPENIRPRADFSRYEF